MDIKFSPCFVPVTVTVGQDGAGSSRHPVDLHAIGAPLLSSPGLDGMYLESNAGETD